MTQTYSEDHPGLDGGSTLRETWRSRVVALLARAGAARRGAGGGGHVLVLNAGPLLVEILGRLLDDPSLRQRRVVVMSGHDPVQMQAELAPRLPPAAWARLALRRGDTGSRADLAAARASEARLVLVLAPPVADPDSAVLKTLLALPPLREGRRPPRLVAQVEAEATAQVAARLAGGRVQAVRAGPFAARVAAHATRAPALAAVYEGLVGGGGQILTLEQPALAGTSFADALIAYEDCLLLGVSDHTGRAYLAPAMETPMQPGLRCIFFAPGEPQVSARASAVEPSAVLAPFSLPRPAERTLLLGWSPAVPALVLEMSRVAPFGSVLTIAADAPNLAGEVAALQVAGDALTVEFGHARFADGATLAALDLGSYDHLVILDGAAASGARVLVTLLQLRALLGGAARPSVVAVLDDDADRGLAREAMPEATCVALNRLAAATLLTAAREDGAAAVFEDFLGAQGMQVHLRAAETYVELGRSVSFATAVAAARLRGEVAVGHVTTAEAGPPQLRLNPPKAGRQAYRSGDFIVVLAPQ